MGVVGELAARGEGTPALSTTEVSLLLWAALVKSLQPPAQVSISTLSFSLDVFPLHLDP